MKSHCALLVGFWSCFCSCLALSYVSEEILGVLRI